MRISAKIIVAVLLLSVFSVYVYTLFPAYKGNDSPETAAAAYTLGIMHPPGYPLMTMAGKIATFVPAANPSFRLNVFSASLAVLTLLALYLILTRHVFMPALRPNSIISAALAAGFMLVLSFSGYYWPQALEAKGGIYNLNLLLTALVFLAVLEFGVNKDKKLLYAAAYIYGLSMANHWPSMIILLPVIAVDVASTGAVLRQRQYALSVLFVLAGLSAYLFLYIRSSSEPSLNWGSPDSVGRLFSVISREIYRGEAKPFTAFVIGYQLKYYAAWFTSNYGLLWILLPAGAVLLYRANRQVFILSGGTALVVSFVLVFLNRTALETIWLMGIFLMPAAFGLLILTAKAASFAAAKTGFAGRVAVLAAVYFSAVFLFSSNIGRNSRQSDFISYDLGRNILSALDERAYYLSEHDMYYMPVLYSLVVEGKKPGLKFFSLPSLQYEWGIKQAREIFGYFPAKNGELLYNIAGITGIAVRDTGAIYRDFTSPAFDSLKLPLYQGNAGLVKRVSLKPYHDSPAIYDLFSIRGIYSGFAKNNENIEIVTRYLIFISMHAEKLQFLKRHNEAIRLYRKAMLIPADKLAYNIYYRMALSYEALGEYHKAMLMAEKALAEKPDFIEAG